MFNQNILNIYFSLLLALLISYYYYPYVNKDFIIYVIVLSIIFYIIFYYLNKDIENFNNNEKDEKGEEEEEEENSDQIDSEGNIIIEEEDNDQIDYNEQNGDQTSNDLDVNNIKASEIASSIKSQPSKKEIANNMMKEIVDQENYIEDSINNEMKKKKGSDLNNDNNINIFINNSPQKQGVMRNIDEDNMNDSDIKKKIIKKKVKNTEDDKCSSNYFKNASRIYNNASWFNSLNDYQHESYNYDKLSPCSNGNNSENYLLPCIQPEANKIPQTLNNLIYNQKKNKQNEVCPIEVNQPWSNYKTGDDNQKDKILPEGYNI